MWSYWRYTHSLEAMVGDASSVSSASPRSLGGAAAARVEAPAARPAAGARDRPVVARGPVGERLDRDVGHHLAAARATRDLPVSVTRPMTAASRSHFSKMRQHLRPRGRASPRAACAPATRRACTSYGVIPLLAARHLVEVELEAAARAPGHLDRRRGEPGGAHVLDADERVGLEELQARLEEQLLHEGIADLHGGPLAPRCPRRTRPRPWWRRGCRRGRSCAPT